MIRISGIKLKAGHDQNDLRDAVLKKLGIRNGALISFKISKRSLDARNKHCMIFVYTVDAETQEESYILSKRSRHKDISISPDTNYKFVCHSPENISKRPLITGAGPCGLFAALILAQSGFRPVVLERGRQVKERSFDTFAFWKEGIFKDGSNVQFGEGGAGTFSDGKLNTRIKDPKNYRTKILNELVLAGAPEEIKYVSNPHIGTFRLVKVVENLRNTIISLGGEFLFETQVSDLMISDGNVEGVVTQNGEKLFSDCVVMAVGHSARDTFGMLLKNSVAMEPKPFSVGLRIEHPQTLINSSMHGEANITGSYGSAEYRLVHHCSGGRSVYSFCMCPGGRVVAATSEEGCVVTNGMSQYQRNEQNANSALVVGVGPADFPPGVLGGVEFQREIERRAFVYGGSDYRAPAQLLGDFLRKIPSSGQGSVKPSYTPGVKWTDMTGLLPEYAENALREAIPEFARQIKGFDLYDAVLTGAETRTSSPVRILRGEDLQSVSVKGLYPGGEGAGYAGGIMSAAMDGIRIAEAVALRMTGEKTGGEIKWNQ